PTMANSPGMSAAVAMIQSPWSRSRRSCRTLQSRSMSSRMKYGIGRWCECESALGKGRLAAAGRAVEQDRVAAQGGNLDCALGRFLAFDEFEVVDHPVFSMVELLSTRGYSQLLGASKGAVHQSVSSQYRSAQVTASSSVLNAQQCVYR